MLALNNRRREMSPFAFAVTVTFLNDLIPGDGILRLYCGSGLLYSGSMISCRQTGISSLINVFSCLNRRILSYVSRVRIFGYPASIFLCHVSMALASPIINALKISCKLRYNNQEKSFIIKYNS